MYQKPPDSGEHQYTPRTKKTTVWFRSECWIPRNVELRLGVLAPHLPREHAHREREREGERERERERARERASERDGEREQASEQEIFTQKERASEIDRERVKE